MRYYHKHALVALAIAFCIWLIVTIGFLFVLGFPFIFASLLGVTAGCFSGAAFYTGREITQKEYEDRFDWKGLLWPAITMLIIYTGYIFI